MSKSAKKTAKRNPMNLELPPDLKRRLRKIADDNDMPLSVAARLVMNTGVSLVESKLNELREPAALAA